ncbi:hypothetical protein L6164_008680 [Bauhinia variegata]|uniref:Uncharacterized protein n=1 Tax=Bauhinia variegata TaxID=167791 RepID=A0ACB9PGM3_BAUVA|nr:hypothetical protein L6164_008680 [Bauhinia variegata]
MKTSAIFFVSLLAFHTFFFASIVTEARPLMPILETPNNVFVKNIYNSAGAGRPLPSPPPPPRPAPPPGNNIKFVQDILQSSAILELSDA